MTNEATTAERESANAIRARMVEGIPDVSVDLYLYQCEGHGLYWEAQGGPTMGHPYLGTFDTPQDVCSRFGGQLAWVYTYRAYEAECVRLIEAGDDDWDGTIQAGRSRLRPVLCYVKPEGAMA